MSPDTCSSSTGFLFKYFGFPVQMWPDYASGKLARPMKEEWVLSIEKQAAVYGCAFFFKQWGTWGADGVKRSKYANGKLLKGKIRQALPV
jgi:protein gp37